MMKYLERKEGIASLWTVTLILVFVAFIGLAIDTGYLVWIGQKLQIGADASALAGAGRLNSDLSMVRQAAIDVALKNSAAGEPIELMENIGNAPNGDIVLGSYDRDTRVFDPTASAPNAVMVNARRSDTSIGGPVDLLFAGVMGFDTTNIGRRAIAMTYPQVGPGILVLSGDDQCAFDVRGTKGVVEVNGGAIVVDSIDDAAACHAGQPTISTDDMYIVGGADENYLDQVSFEGTLHEDSPYMDDPLMDLPPPSYNVVPDSGGVKVSTGDPPTVISPGYYSEGISQSGGTLILESGVYIIDGDGLNISGGDFDASSGVMLYIVDLTPENSEQSAVNIVGNGDVNIVGLEPNDYPSDTPIPEELKLIQVPIFQARENDNESRILGTSSFSLDGTIYMSGNHLEIGGQSESFANGIISYTLELHGDGLILINYEDQFTPPFQNVFLVQ